MNNQQRKEPTMHRNLNVLMILFILLVGIAACGPPEPSTGTVDLEVEEVEAGPILESPDAEAAEPMVEELITEPEPEEEE